MEDILHGQSRQRGAFKSATSIITSKTPQTQSEQRDALGITTRLAAASKQRNASKVATRSECGAVPRRKSSHGGAHA